MLSLSARDREALRVELRRLRRTFDLFGLSRDEEAFKEGQHPRDPDGKFKSGSGGAAPKPKPEHQRIQAPQYGMPHGFFTARAPINPVVSQGDPDKATSTIVVSKDSPTPVKKLNGVAFKAWKPPKDWSTVEGQVDLDEPEMVVPKGKQAASGVIITEPDGRLWLMRPKEGYGGYDSTYPKGRIEKDLSPQANAIKEAYEESGLKVRIQKFVGDFEGDMTMTRYYTAVREGGDPSKHGKEAEGVVLSPPAKLASLLNRSRDRKIAALVTGADIPDHPAYDDANFKENEHPRDPDGKFTSGGGSAGAGKGKAVVAAKGKVVDPTEMVKVSGKKGSNEGGIYEDAESGKEYYVKHLKSAAHKTNEYTAAALYQLAGVPTLNYVPTKSDKDIATEFQKLEKSNVSQLTNVERAAAQHAFAVHAWLANWDAVGTGGDNIGIKEGGILPTVLDTGGSLEFRAQGEPKGAAFGTSVDELTTMLDPAKAPDAAALYGDMGYKQKTLSAKTVTNIHDDDIRATVEANGGSSELAEKLIARKFNLAKEYGLKVIEEAEDPQFASKHPRNPDGTFKKGVGGEETEAPTTAPEELPQSKAWLGGYTPSTTKEHAGKQISGFLAKPPLMNANYRVTAKKLLDDADKFGFGGIAKDALKKKIVQSFKMQQAHFVKKGLTKEASAIEKKLKQLEAEAPPALKQSLAELAASMPPPQVGAQTKTFPPEPAPKPAPKPEPPKSTATPAELEKAKSTAPYPAGSSSEIPGAAEAIQEFNNKYAGKQLTTTAELGQKVDAFKAMKAKIGQLAEAHQAKQQQQWAIQQKAQAEKQKAEAEKHKEEAKEAMKALNIDANQAEAFIALAKMHGGSYSGFLDGFKGVQEKAEKKGFPISGFEAALIEDYTGSGSSDINAALRGGAWTDQQDVYVKLVNSAIQKMPRYVGIATRGVHLSSSEKLQFGHVTAADIKNFYRNNVGKVFEERSFQSSSAGDVHKGGDLVFKITATGKRAADIKPLSHFPGEDEVLFAARTAFKITKVEDKPSHGYGSGQLVVHMTEWD